MTTIEKGTYKITEEPFYIPIKDEVAVLSACQKIPTVAQYSPGFLMEFYDIIRTRLIDYPREIFLEWTSRGIDLFTSSRTEEAVAFFKIQSRESRRILNLFHTSLADIKNILNIYCSSLAGRTMNILSTDLSAFSMKTIYTDGKSIFNNRRYVQHIHFFQLRQAKGNL